MSEIPKGPETPTQPAVAPRRRYTARKSTAAKVRSWLDEAEGSAAWWQPSTKRSAKNSGSPPQITSPPAPQIASPTPPQIASPPAPDPTTASQPAWVDEWSGWPGPTKEENRSLMDTLSLMRLRLKAIEEAVNEIKKLLD